MVKVIDATQIGAYAEKMGKKSTRENKNIYQTTREELNLTREAAGSLMEYISPDRIEKIESGKSLPHPDEIVIMARAYKAPNLCNYFCSNECPIGQGTVPELEMKSLSQITLEMLSSLNSMEKHKNRLIDITADGRIDEDEVSDFKQIRDQLEQISISVESMKLWVNKAIAEGHMPQI